MSSIQGVGFTPMIDPAALKGMDLETAMLMVQSQRASTLEDGLKIKMEGVAARNKAIAQLNSAISKLTQETANWKADDKNSIDGAMSAKVGDPSVSTKDEKAALNSHADKLDKQAQSLIDHANRLPAHGFLAVHRNALLAQASAMQKQATDARATAGSMPELRQMTVTETCQQYGVKPLSGKVTKAEVDALVKALQTKVDELNSSQQMDMLSLQSMMNKRNEAFDLMTNFVKKMADSRSSIIGNMR